MDKLKIMTYNSIGLASDKIMFIHELLSTEQPDVLFLQETWRIKSTLHKLGDIHDDYLWHGICGLDERHAVLPGRPPGGVAILWKKALADSISKVKLKDDHKRICGIVMKCGSVNVLFMNVYMPNDNYSRITVDDEFSTVTEQMEIMYAEERTLHCIFGGDFNVDFRRNNAHDQWMLNCMDRMNIVNTWESLGVTTEDTFVNPDFTAKSRIGYLCCSKNMEYDTSSLCVHKLPSNNSWHRTVSLKVNMDDVIRRTENKAVPNQYPSESVAWHKVNDNHLGHYQQILSQLLHNIYLPPALFCQV